MEKACLLVCDHRPGMKPDCLIQHALSNIHAVHSLRPLVGCIGAMPPHAAAQVQHLLPGKRRQQRFQGFPLPGACQALEASRHPAVFFKETRIVIWIFRSL